MQYTSTQNKKEITSLSQAILSGMAADKGLYIPTVFPKIDLSLFHEDLSYPEFAFHVLQPFFAGDNLASELDSICHAAFNFEVPLIALTNNTHMLELFHGPTLSFKDFGARFLAECMSRLAQQQITFMVATSGDTGSAIAAAFYQKPNIKVIVLFPHQKITERQQHQITCWGENVSAYAVKGTFDDCQRLVKAAFNEPRFGHVSTGNSINIARLLPQMTYYAYWSWHYQQRYGEKPSFIVPSGNFGNVTACFWAKELGFPIQSIVLATNANRVIEDYLTSSEFTPRASIPTLANAMDVGNPSNFERLQALFHDFATFKANVSAYSVSDDQIRETILAYQHRYDYLVCPHTATACYVRDQLGDVPFIIAATAHPSKFETVIEPLIGEKIEVPKQLQTLLNRKSHAQLIEADLQAINCC